MQNINFTIVAVAIVVLILIFSRSARLLLGGLIAVFLLIGVVRSVVRHHSCQGPEPCPLQSTIAGPCYSLNDSGVVTVDGMYHAVPDGETVAESRCFTWEVWQ